MNVNQELALFDELNVRSNNTIFDRVAVSSNQFFDTVEHGNRDLTRDEGGRRATRSANSERKILVVVDVVC